MHAAPSTPMRFKSCRSSRPEARSRSAARRVVGVLKKVKKALRRHLTGIGRLCVGFRFAACAPGAEPDTERTHRHAAHRSAANERRRGNAGRTGPAARPADEKRIRLPEFNFAQKERSPCSGETTMSENVIEVNGLSRRFGKIRWDGAFAEQFVTGRHLRRPCRGLSRVADPCSGPMSEPRKQYSCHEFSCPSSSG